MVQTMPEATTALRKDLTVSMLEGTYGDPSKLLKTKRFTLHVNKDASLKLIHQLCLAMEKKDVKGALALCATPFRVVSDGKLVEWKAKELEQALAGKFGQRIGERAMSFRKKGAEEQTALYWGPKSKRGKATQTKYEPFKGAGWVGVVYKGKKKKPEEAKKPFAIQVVDGQLKVIGFHDD